MLIIDQDKVLIVNFENINLIGLSAGNNGIVYSRTINGDSQLLGKYTTQERAKEVLQEIVDLYKRCQQVIGEIGGVVNFIYPPKVYEMPEK